MCLSGCINIIAVELITMEVKFDSETEMLTCIHSAALLRSIAI